MSLTMTLDSLLFAMDTGTRCLVIIAVLAVIASVSYLRRFLDKGGIAASVILGFIVFYIGGVSGFVVFLFFFLSSSVITKLCRKGRGNGMRSYPSVIANGLPAAVTLVIYALTYDPLFLVAFASAVAEASSDTWAGEIGQLSHKDPVSIVTFTKVPRGISGGVTVLGLLASLLSAFLIALLFAGTFSSDTKGVLTITAAGFTGALLDSFLGATVQAQYRREDGSITENPEEGKRVRGIPFIDNDMVNFLSGLFSVSLSIALYSF